MRLFHPIDSRQAFWLMMCLLFYPAHRAKAAQTAASGLETVILQSAGGTIEVRGTRASTAQAQAQRTAGPASCRLEAKRQGKTWHLDAQAGDGAVCQNAIVLQLPRHVDLQIVSSNGNVFVSGIDGKLDLQLAQGNAVIGGRLLGLKAKLDAGSLSAEGMQADAQIILQSGNAQLWYGSPKQAHIQLQVARGNVTIGAKVPAVQLGVNIDASAIDCSLTQAADATFVVTGNIDQGHLRIRAPK